MLVKATVLVVVCFARWGLTMDNLKVVYQWKTLRFDFKNAADETAAIEAKEFIPENNLPLGLEVASGRIFVTVPRWKPGVPATLTYILHSDPMNHPKLRPYPNWDAHRFSNDTEEPPLLVSPFRLRADRCNNLWVLDTGLTNILEGSERIKPPELVIFDLHDDSVKRRYPIPKIQYEDDSFFANIAVEDHDCRNLYAYLADISNPGLVVYSWNRNDSWRIQHNYFNIEPTAGEFNVSGISFQWSDGIFGLALSAVQPDGYSKLYFHPMTSTDEFVVSTEFLRDKNLALRSHDLFKRLGSRGPRGQSSVSFLDPKTGVLFYALINLNAIACWKTSNPSYTMQSQGRVYMSNVTMVFPNDLKVDADDNLWVLSDRLPVFMYSKLDPNDYNFRILTAPVMDAIKGTACDSKVVVTPEMVAKMRNHLDSINPTKPAAKTQGSGSSGVRFDIGMLSLFAIFYLLC